jgi:hypothetical protein
MYFLADGIGTFLLGPRSRHVGDRGAQMTKLRAVRGQPAIRVADLRRLDQQWDKADLLFLHDALRHGMSAENVAGFLGRTADEVREEAQRLDIITDEAPVAPRP